jgi:hypothetical protein
MGPIDRFADKLVQLKIARPSEIVGCTPSEVQQVALDQGSPLPLRYAQFLSEMGRRAGEFLRGTDVFYPEVLRQRQDALELLIENESSLSLPDDAIVFLMHQGYVFLFIRASEGDDPPVYHYKEGNETFTRPSATFTQFLYDSLQVHAAPEPPGEHLLDEIDDGGIEDTPA